MPADRSSTPESHRKAAAHVGGGAQPSRDVPAGLEAPPGLEVTVETVLQHAAFVRGLARALVRDEALVEDVVQETLTRAIEQGPRRREALTAWLRTVVRNVVYKAHRSRARREHREEEAARPEALASVGDLFVRDAALRDLTAVVLDLPDQAREAILLRYFEGLTPQAIGARLGLPAGTVRMRLHRALVALRRRLDELSGGDRAQWMRGLVVLAGLDREPAAPAPPVVPRAGAGLPASPGALLLGLTLGASVTLALVLHFTGGRTAEVEHGGPIADAAHSTAPPPPAPEADATPPGQRAEIAPRSAEVAGDGSPASAPLTDTELRVRGRVVDALGEPVAGATVLGAWGGSELVPRGRTDADGTFAVPAGAPLDARGMEHPLLVAAFADGHAPSGILVVEHGPGDLGAPPVIALRGPGARLVARVVDADGAPVAGAQVVVGERVRTGLGLAGPMTADEENPLAPQIASRVTRDGRSVFPGHEHLRGNLGAQLLDLDGRLTRQLPARSVRTDEDGRVVVDGLEPARTRVGVSAAGYAPLRTEVDLSGGTGSAGASAELELVPEARLVGQVTRGDGLRAGRVLVHVALDEPFVVRTQEVDAQGRFTFAGLPAGACRVVAEEVVDGELRHRAERAATLQGGSETRIDLALTRAGRVAVQLTSAGSPLVGWRLEARGADNPTSLLEQLTTGDEGTAEVAARHIVRAALYVFPPGRDWALPVVTTEAPYRVGASGPVVLDIAPEDLGGATLVGAIVDHEGRGLGAGTWVQLTPTGAASGLPARLLDDSGRFVIGPLPRGTYRLDVPHRDGGTVLEAPIEVGAAGRIELGALRLPEAGRIALAGTGREAGSRGLVLARVLATGERVVVFEGRVALPNELRTAPGSLEVRWEGEAPLRAELAPGGTLRLVAPR